MLISLLSTSVVLDIRLFLSQYPPKITDKLEFIFKKYLLLIKHIILRVPLKPAVSKIKLAGDDIYYESEYGIANYQASLVNFQKDYFGYLSRLKAPLVVDVGAHIGLFSLTVAKLFEKPKIYACEPISLAFDILERNTQNIEGIQRFQLGFSNKRCRSRIYYIKDKLIVSSLFAERFDWGEKPSAQIIQLDTLDSFIKREGISKIDILKIDTEGAEERILKSACGTLAKTRYLVLEISIYKAGGSTFSSIIHNLYGEDYNFQLVNIQTPFFKTAGSIATVDVLFENLKLTGSLMPSTIM